MGQFQQAQKGKLVTPSDAINFVEGICESLWVGGAGVVALVHEDNTVANYTVTAACPLLPVKAKRVNATNTTATLIVALY